MINKIGLLSVCDNSFPSEENLNLSESASARDINNTFKKDVLNVVEISKRVSDRSMKTVCPIKYIDPAVSFSLSFFNPGSEFYRKFIVALKVFEEGPECGHEKLGPILRKKGAVAELKKRKKEIESEHEHKCVELNGVYKSLRDSIGSNDLCLYQKYLDQYLDLLSGFYSEDHFYKLLMFVFYKSLDDFELSGDVDYAGSIVLKNEYPEFFEIIFNVIIQSNALGGGIAFRLLQEALNTYYMFYIVGNCLFQGENGGLSSFYPELPVDVYLKVFSTRGKFEELWDDYCIIIEQRTSFVDTKLLNLHFKLLTGRMFNVSDVISMVKDRGEKVVEGGVDFFERVMAFELLHTATIRTLKKDFSDQGLLECYDYFLSCFDSANYLKDYMIARFEEKNGNLIEAKNIYRKMVYDPVMRVPVFDRLIFCMKETDEVGQVAQVCNDAAKFYREKGSTRKEEFYANKAATYSLEQTNLKGRLHQSDPSDMYVSQADFREESTLSKAKKKLRSPALH